MFKGAITQLQTVINGFLHAKSAYQWHCIKTTSTEDIKTVNEITAAAYIQLSCSLLKCWSLKNNADQYIASEVSAKGDCTMGNLAKVVLSIFVLHSSNYWKIICYSPASILIWYKSHFYSFILEGISPHIKIS